MVSHENVVASSRRTLLEPSLYHHVPNCHYTRFPSEPSALQPSASSSRYVSRSQPQLLSPNLTPRRKLGMRRPCRNDLWQHRNSLRHLQHWPTSLQQPTQPQDQLWACTTYPGYTYDSVQETASYATGGLAPSYHLRVAQDKMWACATMPSFTYDNVEETASCSTGGLARQYRLRVPQDNVWACEAVPRVIWDDVEETASCATGGSAPQYHLRIPQNGMWACAVPPGWTWTQAEMTNYLCNG